MLYSMQLGSNTYIVSTPTHVEHLVNVIIGNNIEHKNDDGSQPKIIIWSEVISACHSLANGQMVIPTEATSTNEAHLRFVVLQNIIGNINITASPFLLHHCVLI